MGSIQWLEDAGIICRCYNTDITSLPMEGNGPEHAGAQKLVGRGRIPERGHL